MVFIIKTFVVMALALQLVYAEVDYEICGSCHCFQKNNYQGWPLWINQKVAYCKGSRDEFPNSAELPADIEVLFIFSAGPHLTTLEEDQLISYKKLTDFYIADSNIQHVDKHTFRNLASTVIRISFWNNSLTEIPTELFSYAPSVVRISLGKNKLRILQSKLFSNLKFLKTIYLNENEITFIEENCFDNLPSLEEIHLYNNKMQTLSINIMDNLHTLRHLYLDCNPWECKDKLCALMDVVNNRQLWGSRPVPTCTTPGNIRGKNWNQIQKEMPLSFTPNSISVVEKYSFTLECKYCFTSQLQWTFDGNQLPINNQEIFKESLTSKLTIENVHKNHQGQYRCSIKNCADCDVAGLFLEVKEKSQGKPEKICDFYTGWKDSILSLPKKWLSGANIPYNKELTTDDQDPDSTLPKLPVPTLDHTMERYLDTMRPVLNDVQHSRLRQIVDKFAGPGGLGPKLQLYLQERREKLDNWAYDYWLNDMYLANSLPLPVNSNPGMVFPPRRFTTVLDVARFAARMLDATLDYKEILDRRGLPTERATSREKGQPLCMSQYYRLLTSCRVPGKPRDQLFTVTSPPKSDQHNEHVIVACRNQLYCVPVKAADRGRLTEDELCAQLMHILDDAPCLASPPPIGLLTASGRLHWAEAREALAYDERNRRNLELIQRSLMVVCLDEPLPISFNCRGNRGGPGHTAGQRDETNMALQMIHGGGSAVNTANRWFDKTVQLVISNDGACGLCYEHSAAEGVAVIQLMERLLAHVDAQPAESVVPDAVSSGHLPPPERLEWTLEANSYKHLQEAAHVVDRLVEDLDFQVYRFNTYGKDFIKSIGVSPDVYIQLALQLAHYRLYNRLVATYESASTRRFRYGRVDCIRSATPQALDWAIVMAQAEPAGVGVQDTEEELMNSGKKDQQKYDLFQAAVKKQTEIMVENILGQGIDIHLLGLREAAKDTSPTAAHPLPEIFTDESYRIANTFLLSTSQVSTTGDCFMGYGAVVPDGYGASYNPKKDSIVFCLSAFLSSEITSVSKFAQCLEESLNAMHALLSRVKVK